MEENVKKYGFKDEMHARFVNFKWKFQEKSREAKRVVAKWCADNPQVVSTIVVGSVLGGIKMGKTMARNHAIKTEQHWKDTHIYDHSTGRYVELRRKLKGSEYAAVLDRKEKTGRNISSVLNEMGLLK